MEVSWLDGEGLLIPINPQSVHVELLGCKKGISDKLTQPKILVLPKEESLSPSFLHPLCSQDSPDHCLTPYSA